MLWAPSWAECSTACYPARRVGQAPHRSGHQVLRRGITFYGMATFEGPLLSIRAVNALSTTRWASATSTRPPSAGTASWPPAVLLAAPRLWKIRTLVKGLANMHFWIGTVGILIYVAAMWPPASCRVSCSPGGLGRQPPSNTNSSRRSKHPGLSTSSAPSAALSIWSASSSAPITSGKPPFRKRPTTKPWKSPCSSAIQREPT